MCGDGGVEGVGGGADQEEPRINDSGHFALNISVLNYLEFPSKVYVFYKSLMGKFLIKYVTVEEGFYSLFWIFFTAITNHKCVFT